jgi:hypothetical protein
MWGFLAIGSFGAWASIAYNAAQNARARRAQQHLAQRQRAALDAEIEAR